MPRRSGGGMRSGGMRSGGFGGFRRSGPSPRSGATRAAPPPRSTYRDRGSSMTGGLGSVIMQGMAFGAGSEIAHSAVRGAMGGDSGTRGESYGSHEYQDQTSQLNTDPCRLENDNFLNCLKNNPSDISQCQSVLNLFKQCRGQV